MLRVPACASAETSGRSDDVVVRPARPRVEASTSRALAGVTHATGLFVLETLAADHGMRVIYRGRHACSRRRRGRHFGDRTGGIGRASCARLRPRADRAWRLAGAMTQCPIGVSRSAVRIDDRATVRAAAYSEPLFSWIIAPASRRRALV